MRQNIITIRSFQLIISLLVLNQYAAKLEEKKLIYTTPTTFDRLSGRMNEEVFLLTQGHRGRELTVASSPPQRFSDATNHLYEPPRPGFDEDHSRLASPYYSSRETHLHSISDPTNSHRLRPRSFDNEQNDISNWEQRAAPITQLINQMRYIEQQYYNERKYQEKLEYCVARGLVSMTKRSEAENHYRTKQDKYSANQQPCDNSIDTGEFCTPSGTPTSQRPSQSYQGFLEADDNWVKAFQSFESYTSLMLSGHRLEYWLTEHCRCYVACSMICSYEMGRTAD